MTPPLIIAHRAAPAFAPENSLEGIRVAFEQGSDGVEIDVRMSLDQRAYLMHDNSMARTTGWPLPLELTLAFWVETRRLRGSGERVPSLAKALDAVPEGKLVAADIKTPWSVMALAREVARRGTAQRTLVWCSSAMAVKWAKRRGLAWEVAHYKDFEDSWNNQAFIRNAERLGADAVSLHWSAIDAEIVAYAHERNLRVYSWHQEFELSEAQLKSGLDGLITDYPAKAREAVAAVLGPG